MASVQLLVASTGNEVMLDIASILAEGLTANGISPEIVIDDLPPPSSDTLLLVIAPHEFFPLFVERRFGAKRAEEMLCHVHVLNVEQPGSQWFELAWHYAHRSLGVFDISSEGCREFNRRGGLAFHLPLGFAHHLTDGNPPHDQRPIDVLFFGHLSPRREEFFARHAETFSRYGCHVVFTDVASPRTAVTAGYYSGRARHSMLASSKVVLNVHSSDRPYFETHRALLALANGCLLITEASRGTEPLVNGRHFVMDALDNIPARCVHYLEHPDELRAVASCGREFVSTHWRAGDTCRTLVDAAARKSDGGLVSTTHPDVAGDESARRQVMQRITEARRRRQQGDDSRTIEENDAYRKQGPPTVSVVVSLYNYARHIAECLESVLVSEAVPDGHEIVVVDDASIDESCAIVRSIMSRSTVPIRLVRKSFNTGLAETRNTGVDLARGGAVFILDADNWIYPPCLRILFEALTQNACAAVYPILRTFWNHNGEPLGLLSAREWDVQSLVRAPYIDAMAMFDREALVSVGGYSTELIEHGWFGWEDYDLWLKLARAGQRCAMVPSVLASYRVHPTSMIRRTNRSSRTLAAHLTVKFRDLAAQYPGMDSYFGVPSHAGTPAHFERQRDVNEIYRHCHELQRQLADVYASMSWRVTRPLRWIYGVMTNR